MDPPFQVDPARLYDVTPDGTPRTDDSRPPDWLSPRHRALVGWVAAGAGTTLGLAGLTVVTFVLGARLAAAGFALATIAASPLIGVGPTLDWWRHRRPRRRRHRARPDSFPPA